MRAEADFERNIDKDDRRKMLRKVTFKGIVLYILLCDFDLFFTQGFMSAFDGQLH